MGEEKRALPAPINFLLICSDNSLANYELSRLNEAANLREELHEVLDRLIDATAQASLARWFRLQDRDSLKDAIDNHEAAEAWASRMIRDGQRSEEELKTPWAERPHLPPGEAHRAAAMRYQNAHIAEGKCRKCPEPLAHHSVELCDDHLAKQRERERKKREKLDLAPHGRHPNTLKALAEANRKRKEE